MSSDEARLIPLESGESDEATVYVKGFLGAGEEPEHFDRWYRGHRALVDSHGWGVTAHGWSWSAGNWASIPVPVASGTKLAVDVYRSLRYARFGALGVTAGLMVVEVGARFAAQYIAAERQATEQADALAAHLRMLAHRHRRVRVVAHSLGCRQVVEAASSLAVGERPAEIHLCGPAFAEDAMAEKLSSLARETTYLYYAPADLVLGVPFPLIAWDRPLGVVAPQGEYAGLTAVDVSSHFGFRVHGEYKNRFADFGGRPEAA